MKLLTVENAKTTKGESLGYLTGILYLAPADLSGVNLCPFASEGCKKACLNTAGRGCFQSIQDARIIKTLHFLNNREGFIEQLKHDIRAIERRAAREGLKVAIRLNGTSDIRWEIVAPELFTEFSHIQFYDYTKAPYSVRPKEKLPKNYHLTYSRSETTSLSEIKTALKAGRNVAVVYDSEKMHDLIVKGDAHDLRFLDAPGKIVALIAKGKAKKDESGFVISKKAA